MDGRGARLRETERERWVGGWGGRKGRGEKQTGRDRDREMGGWGGRKRDRQIDTGRDRQGQAAERELDILTLSQL